MTVCHRGRVVLVGLAIALAGCTFLVDGSSGGGDDVEPEDTRRFPPDDRNLVMVGHRVVDIDIDGQDDAAIMNASTVPADRGVFVLLGGQPLSELSYHAVVPTPSAPAAIAFAEAFDGGEDGLDLFVVDALGTLHAYMFVGGQQLYDPAPISLSLETRPGPLDKVSMDAGDFDGDGTAEIVVAVGDVGSTMTRIAPEQWTAGALQAVEQTVVGRSLPFDYVAAVHAETGPDSVILGGTEAVFWYTNGAGVLDVETRDQSDAGCRFQQGVTFVADVVHGQMGTPAAVRVGGPTDSSNICITSIDADDGEIVTVSYVSHETGDEVAFPPESRLGFEAVAFGDFAAGAAPEFVALDRSTLDD